MRYIAHFFSLLRSLLTGEVQPQDTLMGKAVRVGYADRGKGGYVVLQWGYQTAHFWYEFAGGDALAVINLPETAQWAAETGIALEHREALIRLMGEKVVRDKAPGRNYRVEDDNYLVIY